MRGFVLLVIDLTLLVMASVGALLLRNNLVLHPQQLEELFPYLSITLAVAVPVLLAFGLNRSIWRLSAMEDYIRVMAAAILIVAGATVASFLLNRLEGVPRSLPVLLAMLAMLALVGIRVIARLRHAGKQRGRSQRAAAVTSIAEVPGARETVLVVGINRIAELYLQSVKEYAAQRVTIAGLLGRSDRHKGRLVQQHKVWGTTAEVAEVLPELESHGLFVTRIVVTMPFEKLSPAARSALVQVEQSSDIKLDYFAERLLFCEETGISSFAATKNPAPQDCCIGEFSIAALEPAILARRGYWRVKRVLDAAGALMLLVLASPFMAFAAMLVALDLGPVVIFKQQRPGLGGRPFNVFKFATMAVPRAGDGSLIPDEQRISPIGAFIRRFRLDELPQLVNILKGDMSFIGPRPLLPRDQTAAYAARLLVRPGLTGWAQIRGGRAVAAADKAALDVWYVQNASLMLDVKILLRTVPMVIFGERSDSAAVSKAWDDLGRAGICLTEVLSNGAAEFKADGPMAQFMELVRTDRFVHADRYPEGGAQKIWTATRKISQHDGPPDRSKARARQTALPTG